MEKVTDIVGNEIQVGDKVAATCGTKHKGLYVYEVTGITKLGSLSVSGFIRTSIKEPYKYCIKITK
jgi:hypothetical protein